MSLIDLWVGVSVHGTCSRFPVRGSISRTFLSLHVVARRLPSVLKDMDRTTSECCVMVRTGFFITCSGESRFQIMTLKREEEHTNSAKRQIGCVAWSEIKGEKRQLWF